MIVSTAAAQRRALFVLALTVVLGGSRFVTETWAAGAFAIGKCGAYGQAYDYAGEAGALAAARKQCKGDCSTTVTMKRACAAFSVERMAVDYLDVYRSIIPEQVELMRGYPPAIDFPL